MGSQWLLGFRHWEIKQMCISTISIRISRSCKLLCSLQMAFEYSKMTVGASSKLRITLWAVVSFSSPSVWIYIIDAAPSVIRKGGEKRSVFWGIVPQFCNGNSGKKFKQQESIRLRGEASVSWKGLSSWGDKDTGDEPAGRSRDRAWGRK